MTNTTTTTSNNSANTTNNNGGSTMNVFANTSTFRNNKFTSNNTMSNNNVVSYEIAINTSKLNAKYDGETNCKLANTHNGKINTVKANNAAFVSASISSMSDASVLPVFAILEDGTRKEISSAKFWDAFVGSTDGYLHSSRMICDLGVDGSTIYDAINSGDLKSLRIVLDANNLSQHFNQSVSEYDNIRTIQLRIHNADIQFSDKSVITNASFSNDILKHRDLSVEPNTSTITNSSIFFSGISTTKARISRETTQTQAARAGVPAAPVAPAMDSHDAHFAAPTPKPAAPASQPATPVVDPEKEALRRENAELREEVKSLKTELASTNAKLDQILAMMSAQAPVAPVEEEPVVEAPAEEPIAEEATQFTDDSEEFESASNTGLPKADLFFNCDDPFADEDLEDEEVDGDDFFGTSAPSGKAAV